MNENSPAEGEVEAKTEGLFDRHPKLGIIAIAAVFYIILFGMCAFVAVLIWTQ